MAESDSITRYVCAGAPPGRRCPLFPGTRMDIAVEQAGIDEPRFCPMCGGPLEAVEE